MPQAGGLTPATVHPQWASDGTGVAMRRSAGSTLAVVMLALSSALLAGCASGSDQSSEASDPQRAAGGPPAQAPDGSAAGAQDGQRDEDGGGAVAPGESPARVQVRTRAVIQTAEIGVDVGDVPAATRQVEALVTGADGLIASEQSNAAELTDSDGTTRRTIASAQLVVRVPPAAYSRVLSALGELGTVVHQARSATDVTEEVVDVASRVKSAQASVARIRELMNDANSLTDVVLLEAELTRRQAELESLLARQASLADQVDLATITVNLSLTPSEDTGDDETDLGFLTGLRNGWDALVGAALVTLTIVGALLPFAILAVLLAVPALAVLRRVRQAPPRPSREPAPAAATTEPVE
ncbi:MAG: DUF4349 domain-containing protein [Sporichthyaceae bacterium]|nr:DUF4349 domain-containing protein [Sporichthyaceae bacterium]